MTRLRDAFLVMAVSAASGACLAWIGLRHPAMAFLGMVPMGVGIAVGVGGIGAWLEEDFSFLSAMSIVGMFGLAPAVSSLLELRGAVVEDASAAELAPHARFFEMADAIIDLDDPHWEQRALDDDGLGDGVSLEVWLPVRTPAGERAAWLYLPAVDISMEWAEEVGDAADMRTVRWRVDQLGPWFRRLDDHDASALGREPMVLVPSAAPAVERAWGWMPVVGLLLGVGWMGARREGAWGL